MALACLQKQGDWNPDNPGKLFWMLGETGKPIEIDLPQYENEEYIAGAFIHQSLTGLPGMPSPYVRADSSEDLYSYQNGGVTVFQSNNNKQETNSPNGDGVLQTQKANAETASLLTPTKAKAEGCDPATGCSESAGIQERLRLVVAGPLEDTGVLFFWEGCQTGQCHGTHFQFNISISTGGGASINKTNGREGNFFLSNHVNIRQCSEYDPAKFESGWANGESPSWLVDMSRTGAQFTVIVAPFHFDHGGPSGCPDSLPTLTCTVTNVGGRLEQTCEPLTISPPEPKLVNCADCTTWNPWCGYNVEGMTTILSNRCVDGKCEGQITEEGEPCVGFTRNIGELILNLFRCIFPPPKYDLRVQTLPYEDKYFADKDFLYQPAQGLIRGINDEAFNDKLACKTPMDFSININEPNPLRARVVQTINGSTDLAHPYSCKPRLSGFCELMASLSLPGQFPVEYVALCAPFGYPKGTQAFNTPAPAASDLEQKSGDTPLTGIYANTSSDNKKGSFVNQDVNSRFNTEVIALAQKHNITNESDPNNLPDDFINDLQKLINTYKANP